MDLCLIALSWSDPLTWLALLAAIVGLGFVIFVHELGHFLVAKACGVKVEKFYLGFDIGGWKLWKFRRGETEYGIGVLPLGGYVKMLGQEDNPAKLREEIERAKQTAAGQPAADSDQPSSAQSDAGVAEAEKALYDPRSYLAKSVPKRMAIISAGVIMNMIFALLMAIAAFGFGVERPVAGVGSLVPGLGAWIAGLHNGDEIVAVAGRKTPTYGDMKEAVVLGDVKDGLPINVERPGKGGQKKEMEFTITTHSVEGAPAIGILAPMPKNELLREDSIPPVRPDTAAAKAEPAFVSGDKIVQIDDQSIASYADLSRCLALRADDPIRVTVERTAKGKDAGKAGGDGPASKPETVVITVAPNPMLTFGLTMEMGKITAIQDGSPAAAAGIQVGDCIRSVEGRPVEDPLTFPDRLRRLGEKTVKIGFQRAGSEKHSEVTVKLRPGDQYNPPVNYGNPVAVPSLGVAYEVLNTVRTVAAGSPAAEAGMQPGDVLVQAKLIAPDKETLEQLKKDFHQPELNQTAEITVKFDEKHLNWPCFMMRLAQPADPEGSLPGTKTEFEWTRDGEKYSAPLEPVAAADWCNPGRGLRLQPETVWQQAHSWREAVRLGTHETGNATMMVYRTLQKVSSGQVSARNLGGPWTIIKVAILTARQGVGSFLLFLTLLSANLAVINFLPIPLLDGGHMVFLAYEGIRRKPADERVQLVLTYIGLFFILGLMIFVLGLDFGLISRPGR